MIDPVFQLFGAPPSGESLALPQQGGVANANGGQSGSAILSFSNIYQDAAQLLKHAQEALGAFGEQLSGESGFQRNAGGGLDGDPEHTLIGQVLGLAEGNTHHPDSNGVVVGEGANSPLNFPALDVLNPIIPNDDVLKRTAIVHSGGNNLQNNPAYSEPIHSVIPSIAGSETIPVQPASAKPSHPVPQPLLAQPSHHAPLAQQTYLGLNQPQGVIAPERDTTKLIQTLEKLGLVNDPKSEPVVRQPSAPTAQRFVPFDPQIDKLPQFSGPVDPSLLRNQPPVSPVSVVGPSQPAIPNPLIVNGGLNPVNGDGTQAHHGTDSESRLRSASIKSVPMAQGDVGSSGSETFSGQHPNGHLASSPDSHHGNSSNMNPGQSQSALRASTFDERLQAYQATTPQRLQIDVQLSESTRVQVDVAVQQRQVYAGLLLDQPLLRNLALHHVPQLEEQLNHNGMELQEFDVQVDQHAHSQREVFDEVPHPSRFGSEPEEDPVDHVEKGQERVSDFESGVHVVA